MPSPAIAPSANPGATGAVGPTLVRHLLEAGYRVRVLVRSEPEPGLVPTPAEIVRGDMTVPASLEDAVEGAEVVFHLAAKLHINDPSPALASAYEQVNVRGTEHLVWAAVAAGVPRFVHFSTVNVYGEGGRGVTYSEASPTAPETLYAETKRRAEEVVLEGHEGATVLRLAAVYGPRMRGNYPRLVRALGKGIAVMVGDGQNRRTLVSADDVARAALVAAQAPTAIDRVYNVTDGAVHTFDAIARAIQRAHGRREGMLYVPAGPVRAALAAVHWGAGWVGPLRLLSPTLVDKLTEDMAVSGDRIQRELGFAPVTSLEAGWRVAVKGEQGTVTSS